MEGYTASDAKPRKRVQRVQLACLPCRQGKLKCNRESPVCDQCYKRSRESSCVYSEKGLRYNAARQKADSMRDKIDRLELFVNRIKDAQNDADPVSVNSSNNDTAAGNNVDPEDATPLIGNLRLSETGATEYIGPSHWESIIEDIADVKAYFKNENSPSTSDETGSPSNIIPIDITFGVTQAYSKLDLLNLMPPKAEIDRYVATWFNAPDHFTVILHGPTFQQHYQQFWIQADSVSDAWLALLFAVSSVGAEASSQTTNDPVGAARAEDLRRLAAHALVLADYTSPQPFILETLMYYVKSLLFKYHDTTRAIWQLHGQVMRLLWLSGYHRDPGNNSAISSFDCEMRRRVWMVASEYDVLTCQQIGMTSLLNPSMVDTAVPGNLRDIDFSRTHMSDPRPDTEYTPMLYALQWSRLVKVVGEIQMAIGGVTFPSRGIVESKRIHLMEAYEQLPSVLKFVPLDQSFTDPPQLVVDRFRLELMHRKALCVLYRPFLGKSESEKESKLCLDASEELLRLSIPLAEACRPGGQFAGWKVYVHRHVHDVNLAAMLLCSEMKRAQSRPNDQDWSARVRNLILQACIVWSHSGITSPKARQCLAAIEKFASGLGPNLGIPLDTQMVMASTDAVTAAPELTFLGTSDLSTVPAFDGAGTFNVVDDPLFQDLFGLDLPMVQNYNNNWPG